MPPRRGGRGRGMVRARPPAVIRESMQEIGMGSVATYEAMAKMAAAANADAARAFFPPLKEDKKVAPMKLMSNESNLVKLSMDLCSAIGNSPHAIRHKKSETVSALDSDLSALKAYYFAGKKESGDKAIEQESIWDLDKCWVVPDILPPELRPKKLRTVKDIAAQPQKKKQRVDSDGNVGSLIGNAQENEDGQPIDQLPADAQDDDAEDGDPADPNAVSAAQVEEDDDLELDADYQTGIRFDDDDGYEEADSGAEEATF